MNYIQMSNITLYCDGGNSKCKWNIDKQRYEFVSYLDTSYVIDNDEIFNLYKSITDEHVPIFKIENRNNVIISIKPLDKEERIKIHKKLSEKLVKYDVKMTGKTTIDIYKKGYSKKVVISDFKNVKTLYIGDELESGNDLVMKDIKEISEYKSINVNNPLDTNDILKIISK